jgi:hypothetical protein
MKNILDFLKNFESDKDCNNHQNKHNNKKKKCKRGLQGAIGRQGPQGPQGATGPTGITGPTGPQGADGASNPNSSSINITDTNTNTNATYYPTFVSATGVSQILYADVSNAGLTYNPLTNTLTAGTFLGNATSADRAINADNANRAANADRATNADNANRAANADNANRAANADRAINADNANRANRANRADRADRADIADIATNADFAANIAGTSDGSILYQKSPNSTSFLTVGQPGQVLTSQGVSGPTWTDITTIVGPIGPSGLVYTNINPIVNLDAEGNNNQATGPGYIYNTSIGAKFTITGQIGEINIPPINGGEIFFIPNALFVTITGGTASFNSLN